MTYRINPDDYPRGRGVDLAEAVDANVRAAISGLKAGLVRARRFDGGLELLVPRTESWEPVSNRRGGFMHPVPLERVGDLTGFVDVRTLGSELPTVDPMMTVLRDPARLSALPTTREPALGRLLDRDDEWGFLLVYPASQLVTRHVFWHRRQWYYVKELYRTRDLPASAACPERWSQTVVPSAQTPGEILRLQAGDANTEEGAFDVQWLAPSAPREIYARCFALQTARTGQTTMQTTRDC